MKRFIPLLIIALFMTLAFASGLHKLIDFENLKSTHKNLTEYVGRRPLMAPLIYIGIYFLSTTLSLPGGALLSIMGGFLFPQPYSTLFVVIGATLGASTIFLSAKSALGNSLKAKAGVKFEMIGNEIKQGSSSYLLFMRLIPLFPFWLVNLAPAFFGVSFLTFFWTTAIGIIPGVFVFTQAGRGLGAIFESGETLSIDSIFNAHVKIALVGLSIIAFIPIIYKKWKKS